MNEDTVRLSVVGQVIRGRWRLLAALAVAGAVVGAASSLVLSPGYTTSTSVLLQGPREADELRTATEVAVSSVVLDRAATALGWDVSASALQPSVSAEIGDGNVVRISGTWDTPEGAKALTDRVAEEYVRFSTQLITNTQDASVDVQREQRETLRRQVTETNDRISQLHAQAVDGVTVEGVALRTELENLRTTLAQAVAKLDEAEAASSRANLVVMGAAELPAAQAPPTLAQLTAGGAVLFLLLGVFGQLIAAGRDHRVRDEEEIAATLGTEVLANLNVPDDADPGPPPPGTPRWRGAKRWLLQGDRPWNLPRLAVYDAETQALRYRRVLSRLRAGRPTVRVLVLLAEGDDTAARAVAGLAFASGEANQPALVLTDHPGFAALAAAVTGGPGAPPVVQSTMDYEPPLPVVLRVVMVAAARPTVPEDGGLAGALVVVTSGTRNAWELVGIAEACADAGHRVRGVLVAHRTQPVARPTATIPDRAADEMLAGSS